MNKRIISLVLALVMVLGTFTSVFAAETNKDEKKAEAPKAGDKVEKIVGKDNKIQYIIDKKFVEGYEDGSYGYDKNIKRAEITRLLVLANGHEELAKKLQGSMRIYSDVDTNHWANGVITVGTTKPSEANGIPFLVGYPDGSFQPEKDVTYAELAKMLVVLVKEDLTKEMHDNAIWASSWMTWAAELGILDDVTIADSNAPATRADAFVMMYNALYKMQEFKRVPANEKIGVLSALKRNELVLNQDKDETYKLTDDTVFVQTAKAGKYANVIKVKDIKNPDYYLGSLIRIMVNDKNEVSHILELGNPEEMALGRPAGTFGENSRWQGVADATASTRFTPIASLKDNDDAITPVYDGYVKVNFKSSTTKAKSIAFYNAGKKDIELTVNNNTKVYVANPANNQMREVKDIYEALALIGFRNYENFMIPNVYAGYDTDGHESAIKGYDSSYDTAKVVVFNVVTKGKGGDLYRVINQASSLGNATLEDTDGNIQDRDFFKNLDNFPYNYGNLYDVIEVNYLVGAATDAITTRIDHDKDPVVEVVRTYNDKKSIEVVDEYGYKAVLNLNDADIFNAKQYKDLKVGDKVQFATTDKNPNIDILSILPRNTKVEGSIRDDVNAVYGDTVVAKKVIEVNYDTLSPTIVVDAYNNIFNTENNAGYDVFYLSEANAVHVYNYIKKHPDAELVFDVATDMAGHYGKAYAANFRLNDANKTTIKEAVLIDEAEAKVKAYEDLVAETPINETARDEAFTAAQNAINALKDENKAPFQDRLDAAKADDDAQRAEAAQKAYDDFVAKIEAIAVPAQAANTSADNLAKAVQDEIEKLTAPEGVKATAVAPDTVNNDADNDVKVNVVSDNDAVTENDDVKVTVHVNA